MILPLLGGLFSASLGSVDTLPEPEFYLELTEAHVCASDGIVQTNEAATFAPVRPFAQGDPLQMRRLSDQSPSLQWSSAGGQSLKPVLRGLGGNRVLTAFQGWRYDNLQGGLDHGLDFPLLGVDHAEILLGPNTLALGTDALSGVLYFTDVRPKTEHQRQFQGFAGSNLAGGQWSYHGPGTSLTPYFLGVSSANQSEYRDAHGDTVHGSDGHTRAFRALWNWGSSEAKRGQHRMSLTASGRQLGVPEGPLAHVDSADEHSGQNQTIQGVYWALESQWQRGVWRIRAHQGFNQSLREEKEGEDVHIGFSMRMLSSTTSATRTRPFSSNSSGGRMEETFGFQVFSRNVSNLPYAVERVYPDAHQGYLAGFYHRALRVKNLEASGGFRGEWGAFPVWSGLARLAWTPGENSHGQLRVSRGSRAPQLEERYAFGNHIGAGRFEIGDSTLGPEKLWNLDAQWHWEGRFMDLQVGGFYQRYDDFIALNPQERDGAWVFVYGAGPAMLTGGEISAHAHRGPWHVQAMYAGVYAQRPSGEPLPSVAPSKWSTILRYQNAALPLPLMVHVVAEYFETKTRLAYSEELFWATTSLPGYWLVHAQVAASLSEHASMELGVDNLLNAAYAHPLSLAQQVGVLEPGRQVRMTLTFQW
ncbi:MAG TPA: hypothetical protein DCE58_05820 [Cryomorphaceae bacterium]|nr:hypothetical protein [Cryomorphaceae bacterium]